jgi:osmotically-inducible protein OsmY
MKSLGKVFSVLMLGLTVAFVGGCAGSDTTRSTGEYVDDTTITSKVKTKLIQDQALQAFQIDVETYNGQVLLSGFVESPDQVQRAMSAAREVEGVKSVKNALVVREGATGAGGSGGAETSK